MEHPVRRRLTAGIALIVLGLGLYALQFVQRDLGQSLVLLALGGASIAGYLFGRVSFLLVVGCVLAGLGIGSLGERTFYIVGEFTQIGLGIGFLLIWLIRLVVERRSHWWPLVPGGVLLLLGFNQWRRFRVFLFSEGWPLILVIVGVIVLLGSFTRAARAKKAS